MKIKYAVYKGNEKFTDDELKFMHGNLTKNKPYEILNEYLKFYVIKNDDGIDSLINKVYFKSVKEIRNNKLNNLGI